MEATSNTDKKFSAILKITKPLLLFTIIQLLSCSNDNDAIETKVKLLVDVQWWNAGAIGVAPSGYVIASPLLFKNDQTATIGGSQVKWTFIDNERSIQISYSNYADKYEIISLSNTEFHFKHYNSSGKFLIELKYDKCNPVSIGGC